MSAQLKSSPSALPPQPSASDQSVDDISDIGDSDSDDDLSHVFDDKTVSSMTVLSCILDIVYFNHTFPFFTRLS